MDNDARGGLVEDVYSDVNNIKNEPLAVGLELNIAYCQLFLAGGTEEARGHQGQSHGRSWKHDMPTSPKHKLPWFAAFIGKLSVSRRATH